MSFQINAVAEKLSDMFYGRYVTEELEYVDLFELLAPVKAVISLSPDHGHDSERVFDMLVEETWNRMMQRCEALCDA